MHFLLDTETSSNSFARFWINKSQFKAAQTWRTDLILNAYYLYQFGILLIRQYYYNSTYLVAITF